MTIFNNRAEGGTSGTTVSTGNSGGASGEPWGNVVIGAGGGIAYQTAAARSGSLGYRITLGTGTSYLRWNKTEVGSRAVMRRSFIVPTGAAATATIILMAMRNQVADGLMGTLVMRTDRTLRVAPNNGTDIPASGSTAIAVNTVYWLELACTKGADTSTGRLEMRVTDDTGTLFHTYDTGATVNTLTSDPGQYRFGAFLSTQVTGWTNGDEMDDLRAGLAVGGGWLGPIRALPLITSQAVRRASTF